MTSSVPWNNKYVFSAALALCSALTGCSDSTVSSESSDVVAGNVDVCGLMSAGEIEELTGQQVDSILFWVDAGVKAENDVDCVISFEDSTSGFVDIKVSYEYGDYDDVDIADDYASIKEHRTASPASIDNIEGEGVTVDDAGRAALVWSYPNGNSASLVAGRPDPEAPVSTKERDLLAAFFKAIANELPKVAAGPERPLTSYPTRKALQTRS